MTEATTTQLSDAVARRAALRAVEARQEGYAQEVRRIVDATFDLIERTGELTPSLRDVLAETGLSTQAFYRYFESKDELLLVLLDSGHRALMGYLSHRMARVSRPELEVREWIAGVLAQAADPVAAARTRPFVVDEGRLAARFPAEHQASVDRLAGLLVPPLLARARADGGAAEAGARRTATVVYDVTFGALRRHLAARTTPGPEDVDRLYRFVLGGADAVGVGDAGATGGSVPARPGRRARAGPGQAMRRKGGS